MYVQFPMLGTFSTNALHPPPIHIVHYITCNPLTHISVSDILRSHIEAHIYLEWQADII